MATPCSGGGGVTLSMPWPIGLLPQLAGWGTLALAAAGVLVAYRRKRPAALVAACMLLSACAVSAVLRAMNQPRHWIIILPALLLLAVRVPVLLVLAVEGGVGRRGAVRPRPVSMECDSAAAIGRRRLCEPIRPPGPYPRRIRLDWRRRGRGRPWLSPNPGPRAS